MHSRVAVFHPRALDQEFSGVAMDHAIEAFAAEKRPRRSAEPITLAVDPPGSFVVYSPKTRTFF